MATITMQELLDTAKTVVGEDEETPISESIIDTSFEDLGFDSLHIIAISAQLEQRHGIRFPEDREYSSLSPRQFLNIANDLLES